MFERLERLIGKENITAIANKNVLLVGLGGVGGTVLEALVRSGIRNITVIDKDVFDKSNLNRQILCTADLIGKSKVSGAIDRVKSIDDNINITGLEMEINEESIKSLQTNYDFIIDACDDISAKLNLIRFASDSNINIICALGTGKRLDPTNVIITTLDKTQNDPLAKKLRYYVRKNNLNIKIPVVYSLSQPLNKETVIASSIFVPSTAGLYLAYYVINAIITCNK